MADTIWLDAAAWFAMLRIGLGLWWLESWRHKDKSAWFRGGTGIEWARSVADEHRWGLVRNGFRTIVAPRPRLIAHVVVFSELALGLGITFGLLTPVALVASVALNGLYFILMVHDWAEQGQNLMMMLAAVVALFGRSWQTWSLDAAIGSF